MTTMIHGSKTPSCGGTGMFHCLVSSTLIIHRHLKPTKESSNSAKLLRKESENDIAQIRAQRAARRSAVDKSAGT